MKVAFDIDDTLLVPSVVMGNGISGDNVPNYPVIEVYKWFQANGCEMILWSGSGIDWAKRWGERFGLEPFTVRRKEKSEDVDICFDDCDVDLAKVNVRVKRIDNKISRKEWNERKPGPMDRCKMCGSMHAEHDTARAEGAPVPRVPCRLLVSGFVPMDTNGGGD